MPVKWEGNEAANHMDCELLCYLPWDGAGSIALRAPLLPALGWCRKQLLVAKTD